VGRAHALARREFAQVAERDDRIGWMRLVCSGFRPG
jgi:hypothetical protein